MTNEKFEKAKGILEKTGKIKIAREVSDSPNEIRIINKDLGAIVLSNIGGGPNFSIVKFGFDHDPIKLESKVELEDVIGRFLFELREIVKDEEEILDENFENL